MNEISVLLKKPFAWCSDGEKIEIKKLGRPLPDFDLMKRQSCRGKSKVRKFNRAVYCKNSWICGCAESNAFYCFPCVLFGGDEGWANRGTTDLIHLAAKIAKHETSTTHMNNVLSLSLLGKGDIESELNSAHRQSLMKRKMEIEKNRYALSKVINCIRFCGTLELALGKQEGVNSHDRDIFKKLIDFSAELDHSLKDQLNKSPIFKGSLKVLQDELLECMWEIYREEIAREVNQVDYVALLADDTTDISSHVQLVIILRYIVKGQPVERFWSFLSRGGHDAASLSASILNEIDPIIGSHVHKLIAQSYDGGAVMCGFERGVQKIVRDKYPHANFIHGYAHQARHVVPKAITVNKSVRIFFADLSGLCAFFSESPERMNILEGIVQKQPPVAPHPQPLAVNLITVYEMRRDLIEAVDTIQNDGGFDVQTIQLASAHRRLLKDPAFVFWLNLFHDIMPHADAFFDQMPKRAISVKHDVELFEKEIKRIRSKLFDDENNFYNALMNDPDEPAIKRPKIEDTASWDYLEPCNTVILDPADIKPDVDDIKTEPPSFGENDVCDNKHNVSDTPGGDAQPLKTPRCKMEDDHAKYWNAIDVCDAVIDLVKDRFRVTDHLVAANLFDAKKFQQYCLQFPEVYLQCAATDYPFLQIDILRTELHVLYARKELWSVSGAINLLCLFLVDDMHLTFVQTARLLKILVTIPMPTAETERCFYMSKRLRTFLRSAEKDERLNALGMLCCEKSFLNGINNFNDRDPPPVITKLAHQMPEDDLLLVSCGLAVAVSAEEHRSTCTTKVN